jgi:hypothetical protein
MRSIPRSQPVQTAFSLPEVMVASFILILVVLSSLQMTGSSILGMGRSKQRGLVDADIASHMETLREGSFSYLCMQGCANNELTKDLRFNLEVLKPLCSTNSLGQGLLNALPASAKPSSFVVNSVPPVEVQVAYIPLGNQLNVTFAAAAIPLSVSTTIVPHAQGWCP